MDTDYKFIRKDDVIHKVYLHGYINTTECMDKNSEMTNSKYIVDKKLKLDKQRSSILKENIYYPKDYKLGSGEFGIVYKVCRVMNSSSMLNDDEFICDENPEFCDCNFAMKIINLFLDGDYEVIKPKEMLRVYEKCSRLNISLPIEDWWFCKDKTKLVIITRVLSYDLKKYLKRDDVDYKAKFKLISDALILILKLHSIDIVHKDTHLGNFMLDKSLNLFLIDLDMYQEFDSSNNSKSNVENFLYGVQNDYNEFTKSLNYMKSKSFEKKLNENYLHSLSFAIQKKIIKGLTSRKVYISIEEIKNYEDILVTEFIKEAMTPSMEYKKQEKYFQ
jgi:tRNA A-37 threonylcarbamoyl transferase component Bud32